MVERRIARRFTGPAGAAPTPAVARWGVRALWLDNRIRFRDQ
jgi:hypothetical protein